MMSHRKQNYDMLLRIISFPSSYQSLKGYLKQIYYDLIERCEEDIFDKTNSNPQLHLLSFHEFLNLPLFVTQAIFNSFDCKKKGYLTLDEFVAGIRVLYTGGLEVRVDTVFDIFDLDSDGKITSKDVGLLMNYLHMMTNHVDESLVKDAIKSTFGKFRSLSKKGFAYITSTASSDLFYIFITYLCKYRPFKEEQVQLFSILQEKKDYALTPRSKKVFFSQNTICKDYCENDEITSQILPPSENVYIYLNANILIPFIFENEEEEEIIQLNLFEKDVKQVIDSINNDFQNQNLLKEKDNFSQKKSNVFNDKLQMFFMSRSSSSNNLQSRKLSVNEITAVCEKSVRNLPLENISNEKCAFLEKTIANVNLEMCAHALKKNGTLKKCKVILIDDNLFYLRHLLTIKKIIQLRACFVATCKEMMFENEIYYPVKLLFPFFSKKAELTLLSKDKNEMFAFIQALNGLTKKRKLEDKYRYKEISRDAYGKVLLGENNTTGEKVVIKCIEISRIKTLSEFKQVKWEIDIFNFLIRASHRNILQAKDFYETYKRFYLVYELVSGEDLCSYLQQRKDTFSTNDYLRIMKQISEGINFLHKYGIVHRNLSIDKIVIRKDSSKIEIKITDFKNVHVLGDKEKSTEAIISSTHAWASPEIMMNIQYTKKADIWSLGLIIYYLCFDKYPFDQGNPQEYKFLCERIRKCRYNFPHPSVYFQNAYALDQALYSLITLCLQKESKRLKIGEVIEAIELMKHNYL